MYYSTIYLLLISSKQISEQPENLFLIGSIYVEPLLPWLLFSGRKSELKIYTEPALFYRNGM